MILPVEPGEKDLAPVFFRVEFQIAIHVRVNEKVGRLGNDDFVVDHGDSEGRDEKRLLHEHVTRVGFSVAVRIFENHDPVAFRLTLVVPAVTDAFGHPDATVFVDIDIGRVKKLGGICPESDFQPVRNDKELLRDLLGLRVGEHFFLLRNGGCGKCRKEREKKEFSGQ
jgi:hypothetical protein